MASYKIQISASAEKQLRNLSPKTRVRIGSYRLLYSVDDGQILIIILKVGPRKHVYR